MKTREEVVQLVTNLERELRRLVKERLSQVSADWWIERVRSDVRKRAERRKQIEEVIYPSVSAPEEPLSYVGVRDYDNIILHAGNWDECFQAIFKDRGWLSTKLRELEPIRNSLMHSLRLTQHST